MWTACSTVQSGVRCGLRKAWISMSKESEKCKSGSFVWFASSPYSSTTNRKHVVPRNGARYGCWPECGPQRTADARAEDDQICTHPPDIYLTRRTIATRSNKSTKQMQAAMESCPAKTVLSGTMGFGLGGMFGLFMSSVRSFLHLYSPQPNPV